MKVQILNKKLDKICKKGKAVGVNLALFDGIGTIAIRKIDDAKRMVELKKMFVLPE